MYKTTCLALVLLPILLLAGCKRPAKIDLGVDVYLHPDSAQPRDVILQAAIGKRLREAAATKQELIHVRAFKLTVFLTGTVKDPCAKVEAKRIAETTSVTISHGAGGEVTVQAKRPVQDHLEVASNKTCPAGSG